MIMYIKLHKLSWINPRNFDPYEINKHIYPTVQFVTDNTITHKHMASLGLKLLI